MPQPKTPWKTLDIMDTKAGAMVYEDYRRIQILQLMNDTSLGFAPGFRITSPTNPAHAARIIDIDWTDFPWRK